MSNSFKRTNPGDASNIFIRCFLSDISEILGGFTEKDWDTTIKYFNNKCAYTREEVENSEFIMDHIIPHNQDFCGLHLFGNIVPCTRKANSAKASKNYQDFIKFDHKVLTEKSETERLEIIKSIECFRKESGYDEKICKIEHDIKIYCRSQYKLISSMCRLNKEYVENLLGVNIKNNDLKEKGIFDINDNSNVLLNKKQTYSNGDNEKVFESIKSWAYKKNSKVHKMIAIILSFENGIERNEYVKKVKEITKSENSYGAVSSLLTSKGNSYGQVLIDYNGILKIDPKLITYIK